MKQNADVDGAEELTRMQDDFYKLEKDAMDHFVVIVLQKDISPRMEDLYNKIMMMVVWEIVGCIIDDYARYL